MKKTKVVVCSTILCSAILAAALPGFAANSNAQVSGGWSESTGYYTNSPSLSNGISALSSSSPDSHFGERQSTSYDGGNTLWYRAHGVTVWDDVYHYTTARMELSNGTVKTTSGRQYDYDDTYATSPWYGPGLFENTEARTYWGR